MVDRLRAESIGDRIKDARKLKKWNQNELANHLGVTQPTVANWESGVHDPRHLTLVKIAEALDVSLGWLTSGERSQIEQDTHPAAAYLRRPIVHAPVISLESSRRMRREDYDYTKLPYIDPHDLAVDYIPVTSGATVFALIMNDDSMNLAFPASSVVVVDYAKRQPNDGDIVLFALEHDLPVIRRWRSQPNRLEAYSSNPDHETIYAHDIRNVIGSVVVSIRIH